jgi:choline-sulfatase
MHGVRGVDDCGADTAERHAIFRHDRRIVEGCVGELRAKAASPDGRPLTLVCGTVLPHPPFRARRDLFERYAGRADLPANIFGEGLGEVDRSLRCHQKMDANDYSAEDVLRLRQAYFGLVTEFDEYVGMLLQTLEETGLAKNTAVVYCSDHGDMAGEHGMVGKCSMRESSARIPLVISWPGHFPEGETVDTPVSLVDLYPTLLEIAGGSLPPILAEGLDGHSLVPLLEGRPGDFRGKGVFCEFEGEGWNHPRCFLREGDLKYVYNQAAAHELYDLGADPQELKNLIDDPAHSAESRRLRSRIESFWDGAAIERQVIETQARQKIARNRNVCRDLGW